MHIDWLTVIAQIVNFLLLVYLLRRFLYRPIIGAMQARKALITQRLQDADQREQAAAERAAELDEQLRIMRARESQMLIEARDRADAEHAQLLEQARARVAQTEQSWRDELQREQAILAGEIRQSLSLAARHIAASTLTELASVELQNQIVAQLIRRLDELEPQALAALSVTGQVLVSSAQNIEPALRSALSDALQRRSERALTIEYTLAPQLICGVEIEGSSRVLSWNIAQFLEGVRVQIDETLRAAAHAKTAHDDAA